MSNKTHWKKAFNKDFLGAHDLEQGQELKVVVSHVTVQKVKDPQGQSKDCNVAHFKSKIKPMILNATACKQIRQFTNSAYIEDWRNVPIQIYVREVKAFGELTEALRIRDQQPKMEKPELTPDHEKWQGAIKAASEKGSKLIAKYYQMTADTLNKLEAEAKKLKEQGSENATPAP